MIMRPRLLAANNLVMGTTNILLIALPEDWRVLSGPYAPEVDRWSEHEGRRWMSQGQAAYRLVNVRPGGPDDAREVELLIAASPGTAGEHAVRHEYTVLRRGFLPRREVPALQVEIDCPATARRVWLQICPALRKDGPAAGQGDLERLLSALLAGIQCH